MKRSQSMTIAAGALAVVGVVAVASAVRTGSAQAQGKQLVRDFFGEASEEVAVTSAVPDGMVCTDSNVEGGAISYAVGSGLTVQTSEPPNGFRGACLLSRPYGGGLPSVCYEPVDANYTINTFGGTSQCTIPAANAAQPDWSIGVDPKTGNVSREPIPRERVLETCVPHLGHPDPNCSNMPPWITWATPNNPNADCPCGTALVSRSCCTQFGTPMQMHGKTATGTVYFTH
jgi:hypothetical protein